MVIVVRVISHGLSGLSVQSSLNPWHSSSLRGSDISPAVLVSFSSYFSLQLRLGLLPLTSLEDNLWWLKGFNCCFMYLSCPVLFFYKYTCSRPAILPYPSIFEVLPCQLWENDNSVNTILTSFVSLSTLPPLFLFPLLFCAVTERSSPKLSLPRWELSVWLSILPPNSCEECVLQEGKNWNS